MIEVHNDLFPFSETTYFLYYSKMLDKDEAYFINSLDELLGLDGQAFYDKHFGVYQKFIDIFRANRISNEADDFFIVEDKDGLFVTIIGNLANEIHLSGKTFSRDELNKKIMIGYAKYLEIEFECPESPTFEEVFDFLMKIDVEESIKWKLVAITKDPQKYLDDLIELVKLNIPAFEKGVAATRAKLEGYLKKYRMRMSKGMDDTFYKTASEQGVKHIIPTFTNPGVKLFSFNYATYGLLTHVFEAAFDPEENKKQNMLSKFKVLSDASRLEILLALKESPKYSLELSKLLGLAPSTVSRHMSLLCLNGLAKFTKVDGKFYYQLEKENFEKLQEDFNYFFLRN